VPTRGLGGATNAWARCALPTLPAAGRRRAQVGVRHSGFPLCGPRNDGGPSTSVHQTAAKWRDNRCFSPLQLSIPKGFMEKLSCFKAYDLRGKVPDELNPTLAYRLGRAYADRYSPACVALGRDVRHSSLALQQALAAGLSSRGVDVIDLGLGGTEACRVGKGHRPCPRGGWGGATNAWARCALPTLPAAGRRRGAGRRSSFRFAAARAPE